MDDFVSSYFILIVIVIVGNIVFWGAVGYFIFRFFRGNSGLSTQQKMDMVARGMQAFSGRGGGTKNIMDSDAGRLAASEGIDLNDNR
jgi:hypothetical protein